MRALKSGRVGVAIPCFNHGSYLKDALTSVLKQTRRPDELIVIDDGSTDHTRAVAAEFGEVDYVFQNNLGLSAARNTGLRRASTEYLLFLDADDVLRPTAIESFLAAFDKNEGAAFVYGGFSWVDSDRCLIAEAPIPTQRLDFAALLSRKWALMHDAVMYKRDILFLEGGFDESLRASEDYDVYLRLAKKYPIVPCESIVAEYRLHGDNMTGNAARMLKEVRTVLKRHAPTDQTSRQLHTAYAEGVRHWSNFWGSRIEQSLIDECRGRRRLRVILSLAATGLRYDTEFPSRLSRRAWRKARAAFGRIRRQRDASPQ
jgi:glycosyltransferase involved in cell wall biosynthesis